MTSSNKDKSQSEERASANGNSSKRRSGGASDISGSLSRLRTADIEPKVGFGARLRNYFLTGLVVVGPVTVTLYIAWYIINLIDGAVKPYIPAPYSPDTYLPFRVPGFGLLFAIIALMLIGALAANLIGRSVISAGELMLNRMPFVRNVYAGTKQIFESVVTASSAQQAFQKVGVMQFPSQGIWALVFVTGTATEEIAIVHPSEELISVFMPTHFLPPSGFVVFVPRSSVTLVDLSVEDAAKIIISAGMVNPSTQSRLAELAANGKPATTRATAPNA